MLNMNERQKINEIARVFMDAYKSSVSIIFIDDIERILEFTPVGMRFSNAILQTLIGTLVVDNTYPRRTFTTMITCYVIRTNISSFFS